MLITASYKNNKKLHTALYSLSKVKLPAFFMLVVIYNKKSRKKIHFP